MFPAYFKFSSEIISSEDDYSKNSIVYNNQKVSLKAAFGPKDNSKNYTPEHLYAFALTN